jgi:RNA polymerase sigma-70 factor (ECF subfamily)
LVRRHQGAALRVATLIAGPAEAPDAVQDAFLKAYLALDRFRADAPFRPWVLRIVANESKNRRRSSRRQERLTLQLAEDRPSGDAAPSPEAVVLERTTTERLLAALSALPERDRLVVGYRYLLELSEEETAAVLGVRRGTVKSRLSRALARLRDSVEREGLDG